MVSKAVKLAGPFLQGKSRLGLAWSFNPSPCSALSFPASGLFMEEGVGMAGNVLLEAAGFLVF